jgi:hypothetical protein
MAQTAKDEWADADVLSDESPSVITFDTIGDVFIGRYRGSETVTPEEGETFRQDRFTVAGDQPGLSNGAIVAIRPGYQLREAFDKLQAGDLVRIEYLKDIPTGKPGRNDLKDFKVQVRRS